jgi:phosphate transport system permease protein
MAGLSRLLPASRAVSSPDQKGVFSTGLSWRLRRIYEQIIKASLFLCGLLSVLTTIGIIVSLFSEAIGFFLRPEVDLYHFLTSTMWRPLGRPVSPDNFGIMPLVNGTLMVAVLSGAIAIPLGLLSAIFLSEYAPERLRSVLKPVLEILAGVPSVVYGYFAISFITPIIRNLADWVNSIAGTAIQVDFFNALSASIVMGVMILPLVSSISEDAMRSVPQALREGAYALGATKLEVALRVVVPAALSGILAGFILAFSRAAGETMIVAVAAGSTPRVTLNPLSSIQTMTGFIVQVSFGDTPMGSINSQSIYAVGATLFIMTFIMNVISNYIMRRFREVYE